MIVDASKSGPGLTRGLLSLVQGLSSSTVSAVSKPAEISLALVAYSQLTPFVLALKFALGRPAMLNVPGVRHEVHRIASGVLAIEAPGSDLAFARLTAASGAVLLAGRNFPTLATIPVGSLLCKLKGNVGRR